MNKLGYGFLLAAIVGSSAAFSVLPAIAQLDCRNTVEGRVCKLRHPIITLNAPVPLDVQRDLGLIAVDGCSGILLNRYWVLTADHCVTFPDQFGNFIIGGPGRPVSSLTITAAWSIERPVPTRVVRNWGPSTRRDIALIYLGAGDFGPVNIQQIAARAVDTRSRLQFTKFGRGIFTLPTPGPPPVPARLDGQYRSTVFSVSDVGSVTYTLPANTTVGSLGTNQGEVGAGGDSGGPDFMHDADFTWLGLGGVQSTCLPAGYVAGMPRNWFWATGILSCNSAPLFEIRTEIEMIIREAPVNLEPVYYEVASG